MKTTVIFDLDGTLINRTVAARAAYKELVENTGLPKEKQERAFEEIWARDDNGDTDKRKMFQEVRDTMDLPQSWVDAALAYFTNEYAKHATIFPKTKDTLTKLKEKGYHLGLLSNGSVKMQYDKLDVVGLKDYLEQIIVSGELNMSKPDIRLFQEICKRMNCKPEEAYYVGDIPWRDLVGSAKIGMTPIYIWPTDDKPCPGVIHIHHIEDILEIL